MDGHGPRDGGDGPLLRAADVDEQRRVARGQLVGKLAHGDLRDGSFVTGGRPGHSTELDVVDQAR